MTETNNLDQNIAEKTRIQQNNTARKKGTFSTAYSGRLKTIQEQHHPNYQTNSVWKKHFQSLKIPAGLGLIQWLCMWNCHHALHSFSLPWWKTQPVTSLKKPGLTVWAHVWKCLYVHLNTQAAEFLLFLRLKKKTCNLFIGTGGRKNDETFTVPALTYT